MKAVDSNISRGIPASFCKVQIWIKYQKIALWTMHISIFSFPGTVDYWLMKLHCNYFILRSDDLINRRVMLTFDPIFFWPNSRKPLTQMLRDVYLHEFLSYGFEINIKRLHWGQWVFWFLVFHDLLSFCRGNCNVIIPFCEATFENSSTQWPS